MIGKLLDRDWVFGKDSYLNYSTFFRQTIFMQQLHHKIINILIFSCITSLFACQSTYKKTATPSDCARFRNGKFLHRSEGDTNLYRIERNDSIQTEFIREAGEYVHLKINWTSPCAYELTYLNQHIFGADSIPESYRNMKIKVEILRAQEDSCFVLTDDGMSKKEGFFYIEKK